MEYVVGYCFNKAGTQLALIKKNRPDWQRGQINGIGGKLADHLESPGAAMAREFYEETGVVFEADEWTRFGELVWPGPDSGRVHLFVLFDDRVMDVKTTTDETVLLGDPHQLPSNVLPNLRWLVPAALARRNTNFFLTAEYGDERASLVLKSKS